MSQEDHKRHIQSLEEPVPEELLRGAVLVEAHDKEKGDHEQHGGHDQIRHLCIIRRKDKSVTL